ncbi:hypothetical protein GCM10009760_43600 [Kitasatospora kazusensis]|uniref:Uncharacterized protein n=1 Tax=Kitasatospora kazusensis TaxID=407974 RepID=A0ABN2ZY02_9ACTN
MTRRNYKAAPAPGPSAQKGRNPEPNNFRLRVGGACAAGPGRRVVRPGPLFEYARVRSRDGGHYLAGVQLISSAVVPREVVFRVRIRS